MLTAIYKNDFQMNAYWVILLFSPFYRYQCVIQSQISHEQVYLIL